MKVNIELSDELLIVLTSGVGHQGNLNLLKPTYFIVK